jgi:hypothetical protein
MLINLFRNSTCNGVVTLGLCLVMAGCSRGPSRIDVPRYDPAGSAARAMEMYDTDGDGFVAGEELENAPGLKAAMKNLDVDKDGKVSKQEIVDRVAAWQKMNIGLMSFSCEVTLDGIPLKGARVTFEPEPFLEGVIQEASDVTTLGGTAAPSIPKDKRLTKDTPPGIQTGLYKVKITAEGGSGSIPAKYNTDTILGQEVSQDDPSIINNKVRFSLTTK